MLVESRIGQHGNAQPAGDHMAQGFQGAAFDLYQVALVLGVDGWTQLQHLVTETVAFTE